MTPEMEALGRRVVACKGWRWMPGMLAGGFRVCRVDPHGYRYGWSDSNYAYRISEDVVPDLTDPATLGCLLALVREAWRDPWMHPERWLSHSDDWTVRHYETRDAEVWFDGDEWTARTESMVLVAALEDAP